MQRLITHRLLPFVSLLLSDALPGAIQETPHNLVPSLQTATAVCLPCHTPMGALPEDDALPLWSRSYDHERPFFRTYDTLGASATAEAARFGSVSFACLACHDGAQAHLTGTGMSNSLGPIIRHDSSHPVGVPYARGDYTGTSDGAHGAANPDGNAEFAVPTSAVIDGTRVWWIQTTAGVRQREDVQLYSRINPSGETVPYVECASCHDPHSSSNTMFLRMSNARSRLCLACHTL